MRLNGVDLLCLRGVTAEPIMPVIGSSGRALVQPGGVFGLRGTGTVVQNYSASFRLKTVASNVRYNCEKNWSVVRVRTGGTQIYRQDAGVSTLRLDTLLKRDFPNANDNEFLLFPTPAQDGSWGNPGNGGLPVDFVSTTSAEIDSGEYTRFVQATPVNYWAVTVVVYSSDLSVSGALTTNLLSVHIPWYMGNSAGVANFAQLQNFGKYDAPGSSSLRYGCAHVYAFGRSEDDPPSPAMLMGAPVLRFRDADAMVGSGSYSYGSIIKVETIYQFAKAA